MRALRRPGWLAALLSVALVSGGITAGPATAETPIASEQGWGTGGLPDLDIRSDGVEVEPTAEQKELLRQLGDVEVGWNENGTVHSLRARKGTLSSRRGGSAKSAATDFLKAYAPLFRQKASDIDSLALTMDHTWSGARILRYKQTHGGRDVHGSSLKVVLDANNRIWMVGGLLAPSLGAPLPPAISAETAILNAGLSVSPRAKVARPTQLGARRFSNTFAVPDMTAPRPLKADLVTVPRGNGSATAWRVIVEVASNAEYEVLVDATTGQIIYRKNQWSSTEPHGLVHTGDDPEAGGQVPGVLFSGIDGSWVEAGGDTTVGNNTDTFQDLFDDDTPHAVDRPVNADQHFDYAWTDPWANMSSIPASGDDRDAVVTQLFYYTNWFHDYIYSLGFTETAGNFQEDNFGRGGAGGDSVWAQSDDGYGTGTEELCTNSMGDPITCRNNANFNAGGADGSRPRMQMYVGDTGGRRTQRANNRDTVMHEYMHGVSGRSISDGNLAGGVQSGALGEGWGDAMATTVNNDPVYGEYNNGNYTTGIRGVAYDDDNLTYGDLCMMHPNGCQVHTDGRIWAMNMWEVRTALIGKHGFSDGKSLHEDLMMLGILVTPDEPSFHDARSGYVAVDGLLDFFGDPRAGNNCLIWRVFAENQLGITGSPDDDDDSTPTLSTVTPDGCDPEAVVPDPATVPEGSPASLDGTGSIANGDDGDTLTYAWDLDDDGAYDDSTSPTPSVTFGDNGLFTVSLQVTNTAGYTDTADATVTVTNVAPTVTIDPGQITSRVENQPLPITANFTDPGWLDTYPISSIDPGNSDVTPDVGSVVIGDEGPPANVGTVTGTLTYGDNGTFTVEVSLTDDDLGLGSDTFEVTVGNADPTATIDLSGSTLINGVMTFLVHEGEDLDLEGHSTDEGSDDLTLFWDFADGNTTSRTDLVNDPALDPGISPSVQPREVTDPVTHAWTDACIYEIDFTSDDDDGAHAADSATVLITGNAAEAEKNGYWHQQLHERRDGKDVKKNDLTPEKLTCYLDITGFMSTVFNEVNDASTFETGHEVIKGHTPDPQMTDVEKLDKELLAAWLNFANGAFDLDTLVFDTDKDKVFDLSFGDAVAMAETVRLALGSTKDDVKAQEKIFKKINEYKP